MEFVLSILISAAAGAVVTLGLERLRWRRRVEYENERRASETRSSIRLVEAELYEADRRLRQAASSGLYETRARCVSIDQWIDHRARLAATLGSADWHLVSAAYEELTKLNDLVADRLEPVVESRPENVGQALTSAIVEVHLRRVRDFDDLEARWRAARTASWILRSYAGDAESVEKALSDDARLAARLWPRRPPSVAPS
jgi:hypothetical protein